MAWSVSAIFQQAMVNPIALGGGANTGFPTSYGATGLVGDTVDCAIFGTLTPDKTAAVASTGYNTGVWTTGNEASGTGYTAGGAALSSKSYSLDTGSSSVIFHAANPSWTTVTLTAVYGDLIYDATITAGTVAKQGMCFNYFGGSQSITGGTFTIQWATPSGAAETAVFNITV